MGATSLLYVTSGGLAILPGAAANRVAKLAVNPKAIVFIAVLFNYTKRSAKKIQGKSKVKSVSSRLFTLDAIARRWQPAGPPRSRPRWVLRRTTTSPPAFPIAFRISPIGDFYSVIAQFYNTPRNAAK